MRQSLQVARDSTRQIWWALRQIFGDAAYENYLLSIRRNAAGVASAGAPLSRDEFYLDSLRRKYSKISCCC